MTIDSPEEQKRLAAAVLNDLLERYWNAAHAEGKEGRDHDTEDGVAQQTLSAIQAEVRRLILAEREACAKVCDDADKSTPHLTWRIAYGCTLTIKVSRGPRKMTEKTKLQPLGSTAGLDSRHWLSGGTFVTNIAAGRMPVMREAVRRFADSNIVLLEESQAPAPKDYGGCLHNLKPGDLGDFWRVVDAVEEASNA